MFTLDCDAGGFVRLTIGGKIDEAEMKAGLEDFPKIVEAADKTDFLYTIKDFEWGTNLSPENKAKGFTHCFIVTFADKAGLEVYLPHKDHQAFVKELKPLLDDVFVFDFVAD